jgi:hypothetical protein
MIGLPDNKLLVKNRISSVPVMLADVYKVLLLNDKQIDGYLLKKRGGHSRLQRTDNVAKPESFSI